MIVGISGSVGYNLAAYLSRDYSVVGCYFSHVVSLPDVHTVHMDLTKKEYLDRLVRMLRPDFTIMAAGMNNAQECAKNTKLAEAINTYLPLELAQSALQNGAKNIHLSCAQVFDGTGSNAKESDKHYSTLSFGRTKLTGESYIRAQTMENTTVRFGKLLNLNHFHRPSYLDKMRASLGLGQRHFIREDKTYSFISMQRLARAIELILEAPIPGIHRTFHLGGVGMKEIEMNRLIAGWLGAKPELIVEQAPSSTDEEGENMRANPSRDYTLDSSLFEKSYAWKPESLDELKASVKTLLRPHINWKEATHSL